MKVNVRIVKEIAIEIPNEINNDANEICNYVEQKTGLRCGSGADYADEKPTITSIAAQHGYTSYFEW